ncbi:uncharacterized protein TRUGW13939_03440 [Talaromyces rugulosus]|uniref:Beta-galactosidase n=1 Tax=Talaromyces rugulosus TaxID=121627 RepID=A0A7H8QR36_TALRU|nr:uncharacterized protein TRUGW13939_03440 [Talaromyces rugulosus]QKX56339.1 hypothetical protein TRUGW13939_03440 [Talaromyces rugulosus]
MLPFLGVSALVWAHLVFFIGLFAPGSNGLSVQRTPRSLSQNGQTDIVKWDADSLMINGERLMIFSGEFHPFRLPVPGLWLDILQKIKAIGFTTSFYVDWALVEGTPGQFRTQGVFDLEAFFNAAIETGLYLIARPGPYINAEVSGGGFPGWLQRLNGTLRTSAPDFLNVTENYVLGISEILRKHQITEGGPIILLQPENEYTHCADYSITCLSKQYMQHVEDQYRQGAFVVPFISNDASSVGEFAPGTGTVSVEIYGFDHYPFGYGPICSDPSNWNRGSVSFPTYSINQTTHKVQSPSLSLAISKFQGGGSDPWGGVGVQEYAALINEQFERVFYKALYSTYGGTNWGSLGHPLGYSSYDLGSAIMEDRRLPSLLNSQALNGSYGIFSDSQNIAVTPVIYNSTGTGFYVVRKSDYASTSSTTYRLNVPTQAGNLSIPQIQGMLSLNGRDSKIHVTNYDLGELSLVYSTAEVFTWAKQGSKIVLILYGVIEGGNGGVKMARLESTIVVNWFVSQLRRIVRFGDHLDVHLLWRNQAYKYWVLNTKKSTAGAPFTKGSPVVINGGYLLRQASISSTDVSISGDVNTTTTIEIVAGLLSGASTITFNGQRLHTTVHADGRLSATVEYSQPNIKLPNFSTLEWRYLDTLPETENYDDTRWTECTQLTNNPRQLSTPSSLAFDVTITKQISDVATDTLITVAMRGTTTGLIFDLPQDISRYINIDEK